jgi:flagellar hook-associated protein FlgK
MGLMTTVANIGIAGMRAAEMRATVRAQNIVNWHSEGYHPLVPVQTTQGAAPVVRVSRPAELTGDFPYVDLAAEIVDLQLAKHAYKASAKVVKTADEMSKTLLDTFA